MNARTMNARFAAVVLVACLPRALAGTPVYLSDWMMGGGTAMSGVLAGSGTTNPSKFLWKVMDTLEERSKLPLSLTYRAVGSGTGISEFVAAQTDFGSGDVPLPSSSWSSMSGSGRTVLQLPYLLGAVSFFTSADPQMAGLKLDACTLSAIFAGNIASWSDARIVTLNPKMKGRDGRITVVHRVHGSSSTALSTRYLAAACSGTAFAPGVGIGGADGAAAPIWPTRTAAGGGSLFVGQQGSDGVSKVFTKESLLLIPEVIPAVHQRRRLQVPRRQQERDRLLRLLPRPRKDIFGSLQLL